VVVEYTGAKKKAKKRGHPTATVSLLRQRRGEQGIMEAVSLGGGGVASSSSYFWSCIHLMLNLEVFSIKTQI
jgi:hypothetical protein